MNNAVLPDAAVGNAETLALPAALPPSLASLPPAAKRVRQDIYGHHGVLVCDGLRA